MPKNIVYIMFKINIKINAQNHFEISTVQIILKCHETHFMH